jgi:hypothetical protein
VVEAARSGQGRRPRSTGLERRGRRLGSVGAERDDHAERHASPPRGGSPALTYLTSGAAGSRAPGTGRSTTTERSIWPVVVLVKRGDAPRPIDGSGALGWSRRSPSDYPCHFGDAPLDDDHPITRGVVAGLASRSRYPSDRARNFDTEQGEPCSFWLRVSGADRIRTGDLFNTELWATPNERRSRRVMADRGRRLPR